MMINFLAVGGWTLDVAFFVIILLSIFIGTAMGLVRGLCKLAGTIFSVIVAFSFCAPFKNSLESWFGMETALKSAIGSAIAATWISLAISFIALIILVRLLAWLLGRIGTALIEKSRMLTSANRFFGGLLGLIEGVLIIFILLTICYWIPSNSLHAYISSSSIVGKIFNWKWFTWAAHMSFLR